MLCQQDFKMVAHNTFNVVIKKSITIRGANTLNVVIKKSKAIRGVTNINDIIAYINKGIIVSYSGRI